MFRKQHKDDVVEVSLRPRLFSPGCLELLNNVLMVSGIDERKIIENEEEGVRWVATYFKSPARARNFVKRLEKLSLKNVNISLRKLYKTQWEGKWKLDFRPFALTRRIDIVPVWRKKDYRLSRRQPVYIDAIIAFGTGLHETTRFMAQLIEGNRGKFQSFLDIGTGTGILSLVALKNGAKHITAIDIDRHSVLVARSNMNVNRARFDALKAIDLLRFSSKRRFEFHGHGRG